jgi:predicted Rossmann fold flavoprotein
LTPGLVPLKTKETWVRQLQGLTLKNVSVTFAAGKKKLHSAVGEVLITHFGVSGPLVLDLSAGVAALIEGHKEVTLLIDLKPGIKTEEMEEKLLKDLKAHGGKDMKNFLLTLLPSGLVPVMLKITGIDGAKRAHQARRAERHALAKALKGLALTVTGTLPLEEAMVTCGGVSVKEIDPRSMQSRVVQGLYFAGEIIAGGAPSGGYNLQQAFSTGYLAGESV